MVPSRLFRSRWSALFWAGGILWTAYDVASGQPQSPAPSPAGNAQTGAPAAAGTDATGEAVNAADLAVLANAME